MHHQEQLLISSETLHEFIKKHDLKNVKQFLDNNVQDKFFYNEKNESSASVALQFGNDEIYELLVSRGVRLGPHEPIEDIVSGQPMAKRRKLCGIHRKYIKDPNLKHLANLTSRSTLSHESSATSRREYLELIENAFEDLNESIWIEPILKVVSTDSKLKIVFDFDRDSVELMDPTKNRNVCGTTYSEDGYIYIGARGLKLTRQRSEALAVLIHEMCHYSMRLLYNNNCKPYKKDDVLKEQEFNTILNQCEAKKDTENVINDVFDCYPEEKQHAELIVRVPHLLALYNDDTGKFLEVSEEFEDLFDFYERNTLMDLKSEYPLMEAKQEIEELNELCGILAKIKASKVSTQTDSTKLDVDASEKVVFITSDCQQLSLQKIYQQLKNEQTFESSFVFMNLKNLMNEKILHLTEKLFKLYMQSTIIVDCEGHRKDELMQVAHNLKAHGIEKRVILVSDVKSDANDFPFNIRELPLKHSWSDLTNEYQMELLGTQVKFQGMQIILNEILDNESMKKLESTILLKLLTSNHDIRIGNDIELNPVEFFVERKFLPQNTQAIWQADADNDCSIEGVLELVKNQNVILLFDEPGAGKSTELKVMTNRLKEKFPSRWIVFMDLKEHFKAYQKDENITVKFNDVQKIASFLSQKILKLKSFESEIFEHLLKKNCVTILMDGFDEICPSYKQFIMNLMVGIKKKTTNQLWIATRPHLVEELEAELPDLCAFKLKPFSRENREEFFEKFLKHKMIDDMSTKLNEIESFLRLLMNHSWLSDSFSNPLLLRMIAELFEDDSSFELSSTSMFSVYDHFASKMVEKSLDKGPEAKKNLVNCYGNAKIIEFYQKKAFQVMFRRMDVDDVIVSVVKMIEVSLNNAETPSVDDVVRVGLMYCDGSDNFHFIHRTFAEFYIAKFLYETVFLARFCSKEELHAAMEVLALVLIKEYWYKMIKVFLDNAVGSLKFQSNSSKTEIIVTTSKSVFRAQHNRGFLHDLIGDGCFNLIKFVTVYFANIAKELWLDKLYNGNNVLMTAARHQIIDFVEKLWPLVFDCIGEDEMKNMFLETNFNHQNVFHIALANGNVKVFEFLLTKAEKMLNLDMLQKILLVEDFDQRSILHHALECPRELENVFETVKHKISSQQLKTLLSRNNSKGQNLMDFARDYYNDEPESLEFLRKSFDACKLRVSN